MQAARGASGAGRAARRCCSVHQVDSACQANHLSLEDGGTSWGGQLLSKTVVAIKLVHEHESGVHGCKTFSTATVLFTSATSCGYGQDQEK